MRVIRYILCNRASDGTEDTPQIHEKFFHVSLGWSDANEEIAKKEAYNGEYTIEDDGKPEPEAEPTKMSQTECFT